MEMCSGSVVSLFETSCQNTVKSGNTVIANVSNLILTFSFFLIIVLIYAHNPQLLQLMIMHTLL